MSAPRAMTAASHEKPRRAFPCAKDGAKYLAMQKPRSPQGLGPQWPQSTMDNSPPGLPVRTFLPPHPGVRRTHLISPCPHPVPAYNIVHQVSDGPDGEEADERGEQSEPGQRGDLGDALKQRMGHASQPSWAPDCLPSPI